MIGKHFKVNLTNGYYKTRVHACSKELIHKYPTYGTLQKKEVVVIARYTGTLGSSRDSYKVALVDEGDKFWFTISKKYLDSLNTGCQCSTRSLMCQGCQCGAFTKEKNKAIEQPKQQEVKGLPEPW